VTTSPDMRMILLSLASGKTDCLGRPVRIEEVIVSDSYGYF
jgi:hypothetical protein